MAAGPAARARGRVALTQARRIFRHSLRSDRHDGITRDGRDRRAARRARVPADIWGG
jgi:hypothetical protein